MPEDTRLDPNRIAQELGKRGETWADADAAFKALDDVSKSVLSEAMADSGEKSVAAAEAHARRSEKYREHLAAVANARKACNRARVRFDTYRAWIELKRSAESTRRAEINLR